MFVTLLRNKGGGPLLGSEGNDGRERSNLAVEDVSITGPESSQGTDTLVLDVRVGHGRGVEVSLPSTAGTSVDDVGGTHILPGLVAVNAALVELVPASDQSHSDAARKRELLHLGASTRSVVGLHVSIVRDASRNINDVIDVIVSLCSTHVTHDDGAGSVVELGQLDVNLSCVAIEVLLALVPSSGSESAHVRVVHASDVLLDAYAIHDHHAVGPLDEGGHVPGGIDEDVLDVGRCSKDQLLVVIERTSDVGVEEVGGVGQELDEGSNGHKAQWQEHVHLCHLLQTLSVDRSEHVGIHHGAEERVTLQVAIGKVGSAGDEARRRGQVREARPQKRGSLSVLRALKGCSPGLVVHVVSSHVAITEPAKLLYHICRGLSSLRLHNIVVGIDRVCRADLKIRNGLVVCDSTIRVPEAGVHAEAEYLVVGGVSRASSGSDGILGIGNFGNSQVSRSRGPSLSDKCRVNRRAPGLAHLVDSDTKKVGALGAFGGVVGPDGRIVL